MATTPSSRALPHGNLALLGHEGHGKSTLLAALLRRLVERPDTWARPRTLDAVAPPWSPAPDAPPTRATRTLRCHDAETPQRHWGLLDLPGTRRRIRTTARGLAAVDAAVLVVSVASAAQAQSREHLFHLATRDPRRLAVFLNACDQAVEPAWIDEVERDTRAMLEECGFPGDEVPFVRGAALPALAGDPRWTPALDALVDVLDHDLTLPPRNPEGAGIFWCKDAFARGDLTVAVGTVVQGRIAVGQELELVGRRVTRARVRTLERHHTPVASAEAGDTVGLGFRRVELATLRDVAVATTASPPPLTARLRCTLRLHLAREGGRRNALFSGHMVQLCVGPTRCPCRVELPAGENLLLPGDVREGFELELVATVGRRGKLDVGWPACVQEGAHVALRDGSQGRLAGGSPQWGGTFATGVVTKVYPLVSRSG